MNVELIAKTPDFLRVCYTAARTCKSPNTPQHLWATSEDKDTETMIKLVKKLVGFKHLSILEHCAMTFAVSGVSRSLLAQYSRHRIGVSLSVQSQRYVTAGSDTEPFRNIIPPSIEQHESAKKLYEGRMLQLQETYSLLSGFDIPKQDARFILPNAAATNFVTSLNLRSFMDVYQKRVMTPGAQWEIKDMMVKMRNELVEAEPWLEGIV